MRSATDARKRLFRITWNDPPTAEDVSSNAALGRRPRGNDPEVLRLWQGISLFDSEERARSQAMRRPWKGNAYIAELLIPADRFQIESTRGKGHFTLWGDPRDILKYVERVIPARPK